MTRTPPPLITGLSDIAERYEAFVVDLWGVMHDGVEAFPAALIAMEKARAAGILVGILSNAPRRAEAIIARNREMGMEERHFDLLLSSGEDSWRHLKGRPDAFYAGLGRACYHMGPGRDFGIRDGLDLDFVNEVREADFLLNTGAGASDEVASDYDPVLEPALERGLPMICANPDLEVIRGGVREICAGAIAARYEEMGGTVRYHGKPLPGIYDVLLTDLGVTDRERVLAIGDSLRTDVAGARAAGFGCLLITGGIHAEALAVRPEQAPDPERLARLCEEWGEWPAAAMPMLAW